MIKRFGLSYRMSLGLFLFLSLTLFVCPDLAKAAVQHPEFKDETYQAQYVSQSVSDPVNMATQANQEVIVKFKNTGAKTWNAVGDNYVSVYTFNEKYRSSQFANTNWVSKSNPVKLSKTTKPGETGEFKIKLTAPDKIGQYQEDFYLAAENSTWIKGGYFYLKINVAKPAVSKPMVSSTTTNTNTISVSTSSTAAVEESRAGIVAMTADSLKAIGGEKIKFLVIYSNVGKKSWDGLVLVESGSYLKSVSVSGEIKDFSLGDETWPTAKKVISLNGATGPQDSVRLPFYFRAPIKKGIYRVKFQLETDGQAVKGSAFSVDVQVTEDAVSDYMPPVLQSDTSTRPLAVQPSIRVGLYGADKPVRFTSPYPYSVYFGQENQGVLPPNDIATLSYKNGWYNLASQSISTSSKQVIRLVAEDQNYHFILLDYDRRVAWRGDKNFNAYRGNLELRYSSRKGIPYVINELPLDTYVSGIAETDNNSNVEYIKAVLVAARSYAYNNIGNGVLTDQKIFDVYATTADQLYLGYNSELLMPNVASAAKDTYGEMVTYQEKPVTTPYFGHSDGYTRTWKEVWGGSDKPWLQRVEAKYDQGLSMYGHGVGMSNRDASMRAVKDGWDYSQILKYYYTGTEVERIY